MFSPANSSAPVFIEQYKFIIDSHLQNCDPKVLFVLLSKVSSSILGFNTANELTISQLFIVRCQRMAWDAETETVRNQFCCSIDREGSRMLEKERIRFDSRRRFSNHNSLL